MVLSVVTAKKRISLYLDEALKSDLERLAKIRKRSLSNLIEVLCEEELERARNNGELKDAWPQAINFRAIFSDSTEAIA